MSTLQYRAGNVVSYSVIGTTLNSGLYEKRLTLKDAAGVYKYAYFERDDWTSVADTVPPLGNRLKFSDGTNTYRSLLVAERQRENFGGSLTQYQWFNDLSTGTFGDWTEIATKDLSIDRRSRWTDHAENFVFSADSTILLGQSLWIRVVLTWTNHNDATQTTTLAPSYNPIWPGAYSRSYFDPATYSKIYPKPGTLVTASLQAKGGMGGNNGFCFCWLAP